jgi:hypothetical protein
MPALDEVHRLQAPDRPLGPQRAGGIARPDASNTDEPAALSVYNEQSAASRPRVSAKVLGPTEADRLVQQPDLDAQRRRARLSDVDPIRHTIAAAAEVGISFRIAVHSDVGIRRRLVEAARQ